LTKILFFDQNFVFWPKLFVLPKISFFGQNFTFWPKFRFLTKISLFDQTMFVMTNIAKIKMMVKNRHFSCKP